MKIAPGVKKVRDHFVDNNTLLLKQAAYSTTAEVDVQFGVLAYREPDHLSFFN
jgi:hypothetical protein